MLELSHSVTYQAIVNDLAEPALKLETDVSQIDMHYLTVLIKRDWPIAMNTACAYHETSFPHSEPIHGNVVQQNLHRISGLILFS